MYFLTKNFFVSTYFFIFCQNDIQIYSGHIIPTEGHIIQKHTYIPIALFSWHFHAIIKSLLIKIGNINQYTYIRVKLLDTIIKEQYRISNLLFWMISVLLMNGVADNSLFIPHYTL